MSCTAFPDVSGTFGATLVRKDGFRLFTQRCDPHRIKLYHRYGWLMFIVQRPRWIFNQNQTGCSSFMWTWKMTVAMGWTWLTVESSAKSRTDNSRICIVDDYLDVSMQPKPTKFVTHPYFLTAHTDIWICRDYSPWSQGILGNDWVTIFSPADVESDYACPGSW
jgi:hypothetical protein